MITLITGNKKQHLIPYRRATGPLVRYTGKRGRKVMINDFPPVSPFSYINGKKGAYLLKLLSFYTTVSKLPVMDNDCRIVHSRSFPGFVKRSVHSVSNVDKLVVTVLHDHPASFAGDHMNVFPFHHVSLESFGVSSPYGCNALKLYTTLSTC